MSLVTEDGTGLSTAESYISVADATTRLTAIGNNTAWDALTTTQQEQALRKATDYIEQRYRTNWKGQRLNSTQALSWPRAWVEIDGWYQDSDEVPTAVANACADLAVRTLTETLNTDLTQGVKRKKIGPLETEYDPYSPQAKRYPAIDQMLAPFLMSSGANRRLVRA